MSNAAQEPRRWTLQTTFGSDGWATRAFNGHEIGRSESIPVIEAAAYDALLAERDALRAALTAIVGYAVLASSVTWLHRRIIEVAEPVLGPAHPDFLTTSATESREAKGGTT